MTLSKQLRITIDRNSSVVHTVLYNCSQFVGKRKRRRRKGKKLQCCNTTIGTKCRHVKLHNLASENHCIVYNDKFRKQFRSLWGIMPPSPSSCMACLQIHYEPDHSKPNGYDPAVCCIKDGNVYFECISAGNNLSTTKFYDQDNQHTNIRTNLKKHMTIIRRKTRLSRRTPSTPSTFRTSHSRSAKRQHAS